LNQLRDKIIVSITLSLKIFISIANVLITVFQSLEQTSK